MNCPFHCLISGSRQRSYRELPLRLFELGTVYRYEKSGVVARADAGPRLHAGRQPHLLHQGADARRDRHALLDFVLDLLRDFGFDDFHLNLSTKTREKSVGTDEEWDEATEALRTRGRVAWTSSSCSTRAAAPSTGPRSVQTSATPSAARGSCRRSSSTSSRPQRFDLEYVGADNDRHRADHDPPGPVRVDRALLRRAASSTTPAPSRRGWRRCRSGCCRCATTTRPTPAASSTGCRAEGFRADVVEANEQLGKRIRAGQAREAPVRAGGRRRRRRARHRRREPPRRRGRARRPRRRLRRPPGRRRRRPPLTWPTAPDRRRPVTTGSTTCGPAGAARYIERSPPTRSAVRPEPAGAGLAVRADPRGCPTTRRYIVHRGPAVLRAAQRLPLHQRPPAGAAQPGGGRARRPRRRRATPSCGAWCATRWRRIGAAYRCDGVNVGHQPRAGPPVPACPTTCTSTSCPGGTATPTS